jgi:hypothetical protein
MIHGAAPRAAHASVRDALIFAFPFCFPAFQMLRRPTSCLARYRRINLLCALLAVSWAWRLQPASAKSADDLRTERLEHLTRYLIKAPKETLPSLLFSIARLQDEEVAEIEAWLQLPPLHQLRQLTVEHSLMLESLGTWRDSLLLG